MHRVSRALILTAAAFLAAACATAPSEPAPSASPSATPAASASPAPSPTPPPSAEPAGSAQPAPSPQAPRTVRRTLLAEAKTSYPDGLPLSSTVWRYDDTGRVVEITERDAKGAVVSIRRTTFDTAGNAETRILDGSGALRGRVRETWQGNRLIHSEESDARDTVQAASDYRYDADGRKTSWTVRAAAGGTTLTTYRYEGSRLSETVVSDEAGSTLKRWTVAWSADGATATEREYDAGGSLIRSVVSQYESGRLVRVDTLGPPDILLKSTLYRYDAAGNPVRIELLGRRGNLLEIREQTWIERELPAN